MPNLRLRLREQTQSDHDAVERLFDRHDVSTPTGMTIFLQAHNIALARFDASLSRATAQSTLHIPSLREAIARDLDMLGVEMATPDAQPAPESPPHPLGLIYVIAGSRLGAKILAKRVADSRSPDVRHALAYLTCNDADQMWVQTRTLLERWFGSALIEAQIITSAKTGFQWFAEAFHQAESLTLTNARQSHVA